MAGLGRVLGPLMGPGPGPVLGLLALVGLAQGLLLLPPVIIGRAIDLFAQGAQAKVWPWLAALVAAVLLRALVTPFQARRLTRAVQEATFRFSVTAAQGLFAKGFDVFRDTNVGGVITRADRGILAFERVAGFLLTTALPAIVAMVLIAGTLSTVAGWPVMLALTLATLVFIAVSRRIIRWRRPFLDQVNDAEDHQAEVFAETWLAALAVKAAGQTGPALDSLADSYRRYADRATQLSFASATLAAAQDLVTALTVAAIIGLAVLIVAGSPGAVTPGDFVVIFTYVGLYMTSLQSLTEVNKLADEFAADITELDALLALPGFRTGQPDLDLGPAPAILVRPFRRSDGAPLRLGQPLAIPHGTRVAIVGETGSGKSSFLELLAGIDTPPATVLIGGQDVTQVSWPSVTQVLFHGPQMPRFLSGPFARAALFDLARRDDPAVTGLLGALRLDTVADLAGSDPFPVARLSGGERRRLALLRALLAPRAVVLLDEPTAELDPATAAAVWSAIFAATEGRTLICATHDPGAPGSFDLVLRVTEGEVTADPLPPAPGP
jgi:ATP-binding cassette subfamily B protein